MSIYDDLLEKAGLKYEDLSPDEKETLNTWVSAIEKNKVTTLKIRDYILSLKTAVEKEISKEPTFRRIFIFRAENQKLVRLQARLRNLLLLEAFLSTPERAKQQLEEAISGLSKRNT